jgi:hypothetical protein
MNWPKPPSILGPMGSWLDRLLKACISHQLLPGPGYRLKSGPGGTFLELLPSAGAATPKPPDPVIMQMTVTAIPAGADYVICSDGSNTAVNVAKKPEQRPSILAELVDGVNITYAYTNINQRTSSDGTKSQIELCYPRFRPGQSITALKVSNFTGVALAPLWIEGTARVWVRKRNQ